MNDKKHIESIANTLISQYGDDAMKVAMLRAAEFAAEQNKDCLLYTSPSPRDKRQSRMPSSA